MSYPATIIRVLVASPSDAAVERGLVPDVVRTWNATHSEEMGVHLEAVLWESHATPQLGDRPQAILNREIVQKCDMLLAFFLTRVGTPTGKYISGTVEEIHQFIEARKPALVYFSTRPADPTKLNGSQIKRLEKVRKDLEHIGIVMKYTDADDLRTQLIQHLTSTVKDLRSSLRQLSVAIARNPFLREIVGRIDQFEILSGRCSTNASRKRSMAVYFWRHYLKRILDSGIKNLFFESGSTIAFLSNEFRQLLDDRQSTKLGRLRLRTNNILTYLQFVLFERVRIELYPSGPPEDRYGATFGEIANLVFQDAPSKLNRAAKTTDEDAGVVDKLARRISGGESPTLLLGTSSGVELDTKATFQGPHVGSYHNKLFKRAMMKSGVPLVLFVDTSKISPIKASGSFKYNYCHPVCDSSEEWRSVCAANPLAFCIGGDSEEEVESCCRAFVEHGFAPVDAVRDVEGHAVVLVANDRFRESYGGQLCDEREQWAKGARAVRAVVTIKDRPEKSNTAVKSGAKARSKASA